MCNSRYTPHSGEYLKDAIIEQGISTYEFSVKLKTTTNIIQDIMDGKLNITDDIALKISIFLY